LNEYYHLGGYKDRDWLNKIDTEVQAVPSPLVVPIVLLLKDLHREK